MGWFSKIASKAWRTAKAVGATVWNGTKKVVARAWSGVVRPLVEGAGELVGLGDGARRLCDGIEGAGRAFVAGVEQQAAGAVRTFESDVLPGILDYLDRIERSLRARILALYGERAAAFLAMLDDLLDRWETYDPEPDRDGARSYVREDA